MQPMDDKSLLDSVMGYCLVYVFGIVTGLIFLLVLDVNYVPWWEVTDFISSHYTSVFHYIGP